jgi:hypothetical protein
MQLEEKAIMLTNNNPNKTLFHIFHSPVVQRGALLITLPQPSNYFPGTAHGIDK